MATVVVFPLLKRCTRRKVCAATVFLGFSAYVLMTLASHSWKHALASLTFTEVTDPTASLSPTLGQTSTALDVSRNVSGPPQTHGGGCRIPHYDPFDPEAMKFVEKWPPFPCLDQEALLTRVDGGDVLTVNSSLAASLRTTVINCSYQTIHRVSETKSSLSRPRLFEDKVTIDRVTDGVRVRCYLRNSARQIRRYENFHFVTMEKPAVEEELQRRTRERQRRPTALGNESNLRGNMRDYMSVLIIGVDSTSRFNMIRSMNRTRHFLLNRMDAIEFTNYGKIGDNTFPNVFAMLTGRTPEDAKWTPKKNIDRQGFRFLWEDFADEGFRTLLDEEDPRLNIFTYAKKGFVTQPVHYYARTVEKAKEKSGLFSHARSCFKGLPNDLILMGHVREFCRLFRDKPYFAMLWLSRSTHNQLNGASRVDGYHESFLSQLLREQLLHNTLLVFMSDHGVRFGDFRNTPMGKFEEMRPFLFLVFPEWFVEAYPELMNRVKANAARLTTPLDLHFTLLDLLYLHNADTFAKRPASKRGMSFFDKIPEDRTCMDAGIPLPYCVCLTERPLSSHSPVAVKAGTALVAALNAALASAQVTDVCHALTLSRVVKVLRLEGGGMYLDSFCRDENEEGKETAQKQSELYRVTVALKPNEALVEGHLTKCGNSREFQLQGDVSRLNLYGNTSYCVEDPFLKKICYCKEQT